MPKVELPYNEEGMNMAKDIKPKAEAVGGTVDFGGNVPANNAQERSGEGDVSEYYAIGGGIKFYSGNKGSGAAKEKEKKLSNKREERTKRLKEAAEKKKSKKTELKAYKKKVNESNLYEDSRAGRKQRRIDKLAKKRALKLGNKKRTQKKINRLSKLRDKPFLNKVDTTPKDVSSKKKIKNKKAGEKVQQFGLGKKESAMEKLKYDPSKFATDSSKFKKQKSFTKEDRKKMKDESLKKFWSNPDNYK